MKIVVAGASGFIGTRLCPALMHEGYEVIAMTRQPDNYTGNGTPVAGDVDEPETLGPALEGAHAAYYLVHSLDSGDFEDKDAKGAKAFGEAAGMAGLERIVYLGGLGADRDDLSAHLRSRREVEGLLSSGGVPVTTLRAGIVVGHGGISWELTRQLVEHLPAMITPKWVRTRCQPIGVDDVIRYLIGVLEPEEARGETFEIGGPDILSYKEMMQHVAEIEGRRLPLASVPLLTPGLSARWLTLVTDVDGETARNLVGSMANEVIVEDDSIRAVVPFEPMSYDDSVRVALHERAVSRGKA